MNHKDLPDRAQVVVVGGGILGTATLYQLAKRGWTDCILLEQNTLTSGTTWHAAGLITQARPTHGTRSMVVRSLEMFRGLEADTGFSTGYVETGTIHLATTRDRMTELRHLAASSRSSGIEVVGLTPDEVCDLHPLLSRTGVEGGLLYPREGRGSATDTTISLARGATQRGAKVFEKTRVDRVLTDRGRVTGVATPRGEVEAEFVVNATGMWGRQFAAESNVNLPLQALAHYYVVTEAIPEMPRDLPTVKSPDEFAYIKDEASALMVGFFEPGSYAWASAGIPDNEGFIHLPEDWEHLGPFYEKMVERVPILQDAGIRLHFSGPESFTPDGLYHLGPVPQLENYFVAAGFNSVGFLSGPGAGATLADWIIDGRSPIEITEADPARSQRHEGNRRFLEQRVVETLDKAYPIHWPFEQRVSARPLRTSPLYERTKAAGAVFGELRGWERANWYAPPGVPQVQEFSFERPNWFDYSGSEHENVRSNVGMFDICSFGKIVVQGRGALDVLQRLSVRNIDVEPGRVVYTQWLNEFGGIEADVTVTRVSEEEFLVLSGPATVERDLATLKRAISTDQFCTVANVTGSYAMLAVMGPNSRTLLQSLTDADMSHDAFPFARSREIDFGLGFVRATRLTYVGELGWELLIPADLALHVYTTLVEAGAAFGLKHAGYYALNSLRLEKAYRSWGHDIGPHDRLDEAGLDFGVAWEKSGGFVGREALLVAKEAGPRRRLMQFVLSDPTKLLIHDEPIIRDGIQVGRVASAQFGHTLQGSVALGYVEAPEHVDSAWFEDGTYSIDAAGDVIGARASLSPLYDPKSERVRT